MTEQPESGVPAPAPATTRRLRLWVILSVVAVLVVGVAVTTTALLLARPASPLAEFEALSTDFHAHYDEVEPRLWKDFDDAGSGAGDPAFERFTRTAKELSTLFDEYSRALRDMEAPESADAARIRLSGGMGVNAYTLSVFSTRPSKADVEPLASVFKLGLSRLPAMEEELRVALADART